MKAQKNSDGNNLVLRKSGVFVAGEGRLRRISDRIVVRGTIHDEATDMFLVELSFRTVKGERRRLELTRSEFDSPATLTTALLNGGFALPRGTDRALLLSWLIARPAPRITVRAERIGFRDEYTAFLTPRGVIGSPKQRVRFAPARDEYVAKFESTGSLAGWKTKVATPAAASSRYVFLASAALAAPLLPIVGMESRGVHVVSPAGTAKTSAFVFAGSTMGIGRSADLPKLKATDVGLEDLALGHNNCPLLLDELGLVDGTADQRSEHIRRIAYSLPSGVTKVRSKAYTRKVGLLTGQFTLLFFTNGEEALAEVAERGARKRSGGETSRFVDLPGARPDSCGPIDRIPKSIPQEEREQWARERVDQIRAACALHHGHAFPAFIKG